MNNYIMIYFKMRKMELGDYCNKKKPHITIISEFTVVKNSFKKIKFISTNTMFVFQINQSGQV